MNTLFLTTLFLITTGVLSWANAEVKMEMDSSGNEIEVESYSSSQFQKFEVIKLNETTVFDESEWANMQIDGENFYMLDLKKEAPIVTPALTTLDVPRALQKRLPEHHEELLLRQLL